MPTAIQRRLPIGAEILGGCGAHFRVWAPRQAHLEVVVDANRVISLESDRDGYFSGFDDRGTPGMLYQFRLDGSPRLYPDPASRFQPAGPHGPSQIVDPARFEWTDHGWRGIRIEGQIIYEMHIGTFTPEGTWTAAARHLS